MLDRTITFRGHLSGTDAADGYGGHTRVSNTGATGRFSAIRAHNMGQTSILGRYPFHFHLVDMAPDYSGRVEAGVVGSTVALLPSGGWVNYTVQTSRTHLFGGTDNTYAISTAAEATAIFTHTVPAAGAYEILLSKPYNHVDVSPIQMWNGHGFSRNVTMEVRQGHGTAPPVAVATLDFTEHDPYDVNKQWVLVARVQLSSGPVNVSIKLEDASGVTRALAVDAVWVRPDPAGSYILEDSVITDSFFRCVSIHGTNGVQVLRNVAYNIRGHCYYLEDGVEENSTIA